MNNLFDICDFTLFAQYQGKTRQEEPTAFNKLKDVYNKLGNIINGLSRLGYHTEIIKNPLRQAGRGLPMKYWEYHWSRIYPKNQRLYEACKDTAFVVVGTAEDGLNIHIDSYSSKGHVCNDVCEGIKSDTWLQLDPNNASMYSCDELVKKVDDFYKKYWKPFNLFGKEFGISECAKELENMNMEDIKKLLVSNYNLILTGAPGTGKTYMAKQIAKAMGAEWKIIQFHPSYDYTDFVEGLRPTKKGETLGFERKDGVFKTFCKEAIEAVQNSSFDSLYNVLAEKISSGEITTYTTLSGIVYPIKVEDNTIKYGCRENGSEFKSENKKNIELIFNHFVAHPEDIQYTTESLRSLISELTNGRITTLDPSEYAWTLKELLKLREHIPQQFVFIIDEINRGEISKIFGELFYCIDGCYRGENGKVDTQYQNLIPKEGEVDYDPSNADVFRNGFYIPDNVFIIGTMNDIDRSVESMDFAMRRRFAWKEVTVESRQTMLDDENAWGKSGKPSQDVIQEIKVRMNNLNDAIIDKNAAGLSNKDKIGLTKAYQIGASYFLKYGLYNNFDDLWDNHLQGLLYEYLRGKQNIDEKIKRLHKAYNDTTQH